MIVDAWFGSGARTKCLASFLFPLKFKVSSDENKTSKVPVDGVEHALLPNSQSNACED